MVYVYICLCMSVGKAVYCRMIGWLVKNECVRIWKDAALVYFKVLSQICEEMSTKNLSGGKGRPAHKADNLTAICEPIV
jgi:hypothetical protein